MKRSQLRRQNGAALIIVLVGILLVLAAAAIFGGMSAAAQKCNNAIKTIESWNVQWQNSKQSGTPDTGICRQMNVLIGKYNNTSCAKKYGALPVENCG